MFASVWLLAGLWLQCDLTAGIAAMSVMLFAVSLVDDLRPLSAVLRLLVHAAMAILVVLFWVRTFGLALNSPSRLIAWLVSPFGAGALVLALIWMTNLYNFMDGADGIAAGMTVIGFGAYAIALATAPDPAASLGLLTSAVAGAGAGFLAVNFPPAKVFLGDAGSIPLGFLSAALGIHGELLGLWPWWFPLLVFSPFIVDATATLARRTAQGERPWVAHRDNYYQRLILSGWGQKKTALAYYFVMLVSGISALGALRAGDPSVILIAWVITYGLLLFLLEWRLHEKEKQHLKKQ
ncbi:MAG: hypothetical protein ABL931_00705 [Usitatibacteraceae bacterium]